MEWNTWLQLTALIVLLMHLLWVLWMKELKLQETSYAVLESRGWWLVSTMIKIFTFAKLVRQFLFNLISEYLSLTYHWLRSNAFLTEFDPEDCPADCSRPCENVCPANAISFQQKSASQILYDNDAPRVMNVLALADFTLKVQSAFLQNLYCSIGFIMQDGVITERCYGCGRCLPVCPYDKISSPFSSSIWDY